MFSLFKKNVPELSPIEVPLTNIQKIDEAGILFFDSEENSSNIGYFEAYKYWCKHKGIRKAGLKYICDRTTQNGRKLVFYTNPKITFYAEPEQEDLWINTLNKIVLQGFATFDYD